MVRAVGAFPSIADLLVRLSRSAGSGAPRYALARTAFSLDECDRCGNGQDSGEDGVGMHDEEELASRSRKYLTREVICLAKLDRL